MNKVYHSFDIESTERYTFIGFAKQNLDKKLTYNTFQITKDCKKLEEFITYFIKLCEDVAVFLIGHNIIKFDLVIIFYLIHTYNNAVNNQSVEHTKIDWGLFVFHLIQNIIEGDPDTIPIDFTSPLPLINTHSIIKNYPTLIDCLPKSLFQIDVLTAIHTHHQRVTYMATRYRKLNLPFNINATLIDTMAIYKHSLKVYGCIYHKYYEHVLDIDQSLEDCILYNNKDLELTLKLFFSKPVQAGLKNKYMLATQSRDEYCKRNPNSVSSNNLINCERNILLYGVLGEHLLAQLAITTRMGDSYHKPIWFRAPRLMLNLWDIHKEDFGKLKSLKIKQLNEVRELLTQNHEQGKNPLNPATRQFYVNINTFDDTTFQIEFRNGGLHYMNDSYTHKPLCSNETSTFINLDVTSYYPNLLRTLPHVIQKGTHYIEFIEQYACITKQRVLAKKQKNKSLSDTLKLALNSGYGKSPNIIRDSICARGQVYLMDVIARAVSIKNVYCVSANTDGILLQVPTDKVKKISDELIHHMHHITDKESYNLELEILHLAYYANVSTCVRITKYAHEQNLGFFGSVTKGLSCNIDPTDIGRKMPQIISFWSYHKICGTLGDEENQKKLVLRIAKEHPTWLMVVRGVKKIAKQRAKLEQQQPDGSWVKAKSPAYISLGNLDNSMRLRGRTIEKKFNSKTEKIEYSYMQFSEWVLPPKDNYLSEEFLTDNIDVILEYLDEAFDKYLAPSSTLLSASNDCSKLTIYTTPRVALEKSKWFESQKPMSIQELYDYISSNKKNEELALKYKTLSKADQLSYKQNKALALRSIKVTKTESKTYVVKRKGIMCFDIDKDGLKGSTPDEMKYKVIKNVTECTLTYKSISGTGIHFIVVTNITINSKSLYKHIARDLIKEYENTLNCKIDEGSLERFRHFVIPFDQNPRFSKTAPVRDIKDLYNRYADSLPTTVTTESARNPLNITLHTSAIPTLASTVRSVLDGLSLSNVGHESRMHCGNVVSMLKDLYRKKTSTVRQQLKSQIDEIIKIALEAGDQRDMYKAKKDFESTLREKRRLRLDKIYFLLPAGFKAIFTTSPPIPKALNDLIILGKNAILTAPTGTGKTHSIYTYSINSYPDKTIIYIYLQTTHHALSAYNTICELIMNTHQEAKDRGVIYITNRSACKLNTSTGTSLQIKGKNLIKYLHPRVNVIITNQPLLEDPDKHVNPDNIDEPKRYNESVKVNTFSRISGLLDITGFKKIVFVDEVDKFLSDRVTHVPLSQEYILNPKKNKRVTPATKTEVADGTPLVHFYSLPIDCKKGKAQELRLTNYKDLKPRETLGKYLIHLTNKLTAETMSMKLTMVGQEVYQVNYKLFLSNHIEEYVKDKNIELDGEETEITLTLFEKLTSLIKELDSPKLLRVTNDKKSVNIVNSEISLLGCDGSLLKRLKEFNVQLIGLTATWCENPIAKEVLNIYNINLTHMCEHTDSTFIKPDRISNTDLVDALRRMGYITTGKESIIQLVKKYESGEFGTPKNLLLFVKDKETATYVQETLWKTRKINSSILTSRQISTPDIDGGVCRLSPATIFISPIYAGIARGSNWNSIDDVFICFAHRPNSSTEAILQAIQVETKIESGELSREQADAQVKEDVIQSVIQCLGRVSRYHEKNEKVNDKRIFFYPLNLSEKGLDAFKEYLTKIYKRTSIKPKNFDDNNV